MRKEGFEPPRPFGHKILSLARLPVPPLPHRYIYNKAKYLPLRRCGCPSRFSLNSHRPSSLSTCASPKLRNRGAVSFSILPLARLPSATRGHHNPFVTRAGGRRLTFAASNADATELIDRRTKSRWNAYGQCVAGRLKGSKLEPLILQPEYWFAWSDFHHDTAIYTRQ